MIVAAVDAAAQDCSRVHPGSRPLTRALVAADRTAAPAPVSDDRPFPYLLTPSIPSPYLLVLLGILLVSVAAVRVAGGRPARLRPYVDLAFLGAAFLLLETRGVTRFALLFGTTWLVNALVFAGVLVCVLLAVEITRRLARPPSRVAGYALLAASLALTAFVPTAALLQLPIPARLAAAVAVTFAPIVAANIVFAARSGNRRRHGGLRREPAGGDGRGLPGVPRPADRLPGAGRDRGRPLPVRVPAGTARPLTQV